MTSLVVGLALATLVAGAAAAGWVCRSQALAWVQPARTPGVEGVPPGAPAGTEGGWLTAPDGTRLRYWFVPAPGGPRPAVVLIHGLLANRDTMLPRAAILARNGFAALVLELRAHGASGGVYSTLGQRETEDVTVGLAYLATRAEVDRSRVAVLGHSLGAVVALRAAAAESDIRAVVAESAFISVEAIAPAVIRGLSGRRPIPFTGAVLWMMDWLTGSTPSAVRADDATRGLRVPVLFVHGALDSVAPLHGGRELAGLTGGADLFVIERAGHADLLEIDGEGYERHVTAFLLAAL